MSILLTKTHRSHIKAGFVRLTVEVYALFNVGSNHTVTQDWSSYPGLYEAWALEWRHGVPYRNDEIDFEAFQVTLPDGAGCNRFEEDVPDKGIRAGDHVTVLPGEEPPSILHQTRNLDHADLVMLAAEGKVTQVEEEDLPEDAGRRHAALLAMYRRDQ